MLSLGRREQGYTVQFSGCGGSDTSAVEEGFSNFNVHANHLAIFVSTESDSVSPG